MSDLAEFLPQDMSEQAKVSYIERNPDVATLVKNHLELDKTLKTGFRVPGDDAPADEWTKFHQRRGAPEGADGYGVPDCNDSTVKSFLDAARPTALAEGVTTKAWDSLCSKFAEFGNARHKETSDEQMSRNQERTHKLKEKYGIKYAETEAIAQRYWDYFMDSMDPQARVELEAKGVDKDPAIWDLLLTVGKVLGPTRVPTTMVHHQMHRESQDDKNKKRMREILQTDAYRENKHPDHKAIRMELQRLYEATPESALQ